MVNAPTLQLLEWIDERQRSYAETMEAWRSHCPRLTIWEDAVAERLVEVRDGSVAVTECGRTQMNCWGQTLRGQTPPKPERKPKAYAEAD